METKKIAVLPGDGIGPEIMTEALKVLEKISNDFKINFEFQFADVGGVAIDNQGKALPAKTLEICQNSEAILFGSVGGPKWENLPPEEQPERGALLPLRKKFNLYANLRPTIVFSELTKVSPLKAEIIGNGLDFLIIRELTGGIYFGQPKGIDKDKNKGFDTLVYSKDEIARIATLAFETALKRNKKLTSIDKANVLSSMVLWREVVSDIGKKYPDVTLNHLYVDNAAMQIIKNPKQFDVVLCGNMFGDILSDEASMITGSLGMLPSASLSSDFFGLYEPAGGSAPDIANQNIANPIAQILSAAMMLKYTFQKPEAYDRIYQAIKKVLKEGYRTTDLATPDCQKVGTKEMGDLITNAL